MRLKEVKGYAQLREILKEASWQEFEKIVGKIFKLNGYEVEVGKVMTFKETKRQYDVIAEKGSSKIVVDCKKWSKKRRKKYKLKKAVKKQIERTKRLSNSKEIYPLIVTSCKGPIKTYKEVPIIPVQKLNHFLLNFRENKRKILNFNK